MIGKLSADRRTARAGVFEHTKRRREPGRFLPPVEHDRSRRDDERGKAVGLGLRVPAGREERKDHHRLAETHVVREAAAETESLQEEQPAEPFALIAAQRALERRRRFRGRDAIERFQLRAGARERVVPRSLRLRRDQRVEQRRL